MALTTLDIAKTSRIDRLVKGTKLRHVILKTSTGAGGADYSSGFTINPLALGFTAIWQVLGATVETGAGVTGASKLTWNYDHVSGKLRFFRGPSLFMNGVQLVGTGATVTAPLSANAFTLKANTLAAAGQGLRFRAWGTKTAAAEAGTFTINFGGTIANPPVGGQTIINLISTANAVAQHWIVQAEIIRISATTQQIIAWGQAAVDNTATLTNKVCDTLFTAGSQDLTTNLNILPTILATTGTTVTLEGQTAELIGTPSQVEEDGTVINANAQMRLVILGI